MASQPNPLRIGFAIMKARRTAKPAATGTGSLDHGDYAAVLADLKQRGISFLPECRPSLYEYRDRLERIAPDSLNRDESFAYWLNLYNAGALALAGEAMAEGKDTVLRVPGAFDDAWASVQGESLSLNDIEHGKIRRFGDPRIHGALVCGSASCPTLRLEPYGGDVDVQLDDQMRTFLAMGGASVDREASTIRLSRVFLWYGRDFVMPHRMPTLLPARRRTVANAVASWLSPGDELWVRKTVPKVEFAAYDWALACSIA